MQYEINRRNFVAGAAGIAVATGGVSAQETDIPKKYSAFDQVEIGQTGIKTSRLCFGTGVKSYNRTSKQVQMGRDNFIKLIRDAYEMGIRCFDAADLYGSHEILAEALQSYPRDSYALITKIWWRPKGLPETERPGAGILIPRFLKELQTDYIDMVHVHCVNSETWLVDQKSYMDDLETFKQKGVIRAHGCSAHGFPGLKVCVDTSWVDAVHIRINPFGKNMNGTVQENLAVARQLKAQNKGLVGMKILGEGSFGDDKNMVNQSIAFALKEAQVDVLNIGFMNMAEIEDIVARIAGV